MTKNSNQGGPALKPFADNSYLNTVIAEILVRDLISHINFYTFGWKYEN